MTVDIWVLAVLGALWFVTVCYIAHLKSKYSELEMKLIGFVRARDKLCEDQCNIHDKIDKINERLEKMEGSCQMHFSGYSKRLREIEQDVNSLYKDVNTRLNEMRLVARDVLEVSKAAHSVNVPSVDIPKVTSAVEYWAEKADLAPIVDDSDEEEEAVDVIDEEIVDRGPTYRWIFPCEDPDHEERLVFGQWYTVIGTLKTKLKSDGSPMITTMEGMWNRHCFISTDNEPFDKVYAYILMPSSSDIMEKVIDIALREG